MPTVMATTVETAATESTLATLSTVPNAGAPERPASKMLEITDATVRTTTMPADMNSPGVVRSFKSSRLTSRLITVTLSGGRWP